MLTDYHVHLRPDDDGTSAADYFTSANVERYRSIATERGIEELGVAEHVHRFQQALEVWDHPSGASRPSMTSTPTAPSYASRPTSS